MSSADGVSREVAWRVFADEYDDATLAFKQGDDERAPNYVVTPTGAKVNRLFAVGVLTETENVGNDGDMYRARISDPTGAFVAYAGQYQQEAMSFFADADPPMFVAVVGKARTYDPDDGDRIYTSIRPEEVNGVDGATRDRWNVQTARQTLARIDAVASYFRGTAESDGANALLARLHDLDATAAHYDLDAAYLTDLRRQCLDVLADMAGEEVDDDAARVDLDVEPPAGGAERPSATDETSAEGPPHGETGSAGTPSDGPTTGGTATEEEPTTAGTAADEEPDDGDAAVAADADGADDDGDDGGFDPDDFGDVDQEPVDGTGDDAATEAAGATDAAAGDEPAETPDDAADPEDAAAGGASDESPDEGGPETSDAPGGVADVAGAGTTDAADEDPGAASGADAPADAGTAGEEEWEWDEGERERLEDEFGAEFESASDFDPDEATVSEDASADAEPAGTGDTASPAGGSAPEEDGDADEAEATDDEPEETDDAGGEDGGEDGGAESDDGADAGGEGDGAEAAEADAADAGAAGAAEDPEDVVMAVLEDAEPEGLSQDAVVAAAEDRGVGAEAAEEALDDLLMEGLCYESGDVVKPL